MKKRISKKIILIILIIVILLGGLGYFIIKKPEFISELLESDYRTVIEEEDTVTTDIVITKGVYQAGDLVYLTYTEDKVKVSLLDLVVEQAYALEEGDVVALYEITMEEATRLETEDIDVNMTLLLTEDEIEEIGVKNIGKHIKQEKLQNGSEEEKLQIQNKHQEREQEFIKDREEKQIETNAGNEDATNGNEDATNGNEDAGNDNSSENGNN
jgi:hypothetical protein